MYVLGNIHTYSYNYKTKLFVLVLSLISITGSLTLIGELYNKCLMHDTTHKYHQYI
jgi:hypothetical protein